MPLLLIVWLKMKFKLDKLYANRNQVYKIIGLALIVIAIGGATYPFWGAVTTSEPNVLEQLGQSETQAQNLVASIVLICDKKSIGHPVFIMLPSVGCASRSPKPYCEGSNPSGCAKV